MAVPIQVTFDCADPDRLARFWAEALGYKIQDPPDGFDSWEAFLEKQGVPKDQWNSASAIVDPEGKGPRVYFQQVSTPKLAKNRVHLDVNVGLEGDAARGHEERRKLVAAAVEKLSALGATKQREEEQRGEYWIVMQDPE